MSSFYVGFVLKSAAPAESGIESYSGITQASLYGVYGKSEAIRCTISKLSLSIVSIRHTIRSRMVLEINSFDTTIWQIASMRMLQNTCPDNLPE